MTNEQFFKKLIEEECPNAGRIKIFFERILFKWWLKAPGGVDGETNEDFIRKIPFYNEDEDSFS